MYKRFEQLLGDGSFLGIKISYDVQKKSNGIADCFLIGEKFIGDENVALILGDNFFYAQSLTKKLKECAKLNEGATVILHPVRNPSSFGVAGKIIRSNPEKNKITNVSY